MPTDALWIPPPPDRFIAVHVVIARPDLGEIALPETVPMGGFTLLDGRVVLILVSVEKIEDQHNQLIAAALTQSIRQARENGVDLAAAVAPRAALAGYNTEGERAVWDVVVPQAVGDEINESDTPPR